MKNIILVEDDLIYPGTWQVISCNYNDKKGLTASLKKWKDDEDDEDDEDGEDEYEDDEVEISGKRYSDPDGDWEITGITYINNGIFADIKSLRSRAHYDGEMSVALSEALYFLENSPID